MKWLIAARVLVAVVLLASVASAEVRRLLDRPKLSERSHCLAAPAGQFVFSVLVAVGLASVVVR